MNTIVCTLSFKEAFTYELTPVMPLAHYNDVGRELHEHRSEFLTTRNGIMGKFGASI